MSWAETPSHGRGWDDLGIAACVTAWIVERKRHLQTTGIERVH